MLWVSTGPRLALSFYLSQGLVHRPQRRRNLSDEAIAVHASGQVNCLWGIDPGDKPRTDTPDVSASGAFAADALFANDPRSRLWSNARLRKDAPPPAARSSSRHAQEGAARLLPRRYPQADRPAANASVPARHAYRHPPCGSPSGQAEVRLLWHWPLGRAASPCLASKVRGRVQAGSGL
jgi:hypothetical protein